MKKKRTSNLAIRDELSCQGHYLVTQTTTDLGSITSQKSDGLTYTAEEACDLAQPSVAERRLAIAV